MSSKELDALREIVAVGTVAVIVHGITSKKCEVAHTMFAVLGVVVALLTLTVAGQRPQHG